MRWERQFSLGLPTSLVSREPPSEEQGVKLGSWLSEQRKRKANSDLPSDQRNKKIRVMSAEQQRRLEEAGVRWRITRT